MVDIREQLGVDRVLDPPGSLPQTAQRLDPTGPVRAHEVEVEVERLCLDSTSHRNLRDRARGDADPIAARIREIVESRGKMHNPETDSGGILLGTVAAVGERFSSPPPIGTEIATLGSLTLTPLRLDAVTGLDPDSPQVEVTGTAYVFDRASWAPIPDDLPLATALEVYDVCAAASQLRDLVPADGSVCVLGAGHAGKLALAAARDRIGSGTLIAADVDSRAVERVTELGLCDVGVTADLRDPLARGRGDAGRRGAPGRPHGRRRQRDRLRADRDPPDRRGGHGAVLLDGDELLRRGARRRRDRSETFGCWSAAASRPTAAPTHSILSAARGRCARRSASRPRSPCERRARALDAPPGTGCRCAGGTSTGSATSTTPSSSPTSRRGGTRS